MKSKYTKKATLRFIRFNLIHSSSLLFFHSPPPFDFAIYLKINCLSQIIMDAKEEKRRKEIDVNLIWRTICEFNFWWTWRRKQCNALYTAQCDGNWLFIYSFHSRWCLKISKEFIPWIFTSSLNFDVWKYDRERESKSVSLMLPTLDILIISVT